MNELIRFLTLRAQIADLNQDLYLDVKTKVAHYSGESSFYLASRILAFLLSYTGVEKFNNNISSSETEIYTRPGNIASYDPYEHEILGYLFTPDTFTKDSFEKLMRKSQSELTIFGFAALEQFNLLRNLLVNRKVRYEAKFVEIDKEELELLPEMVSSQIALTISDAEFYIAGDTTNIKGVFEYL